MRNREHPDGLPGLDRSDDLRVQIANKLFERACLLFAKATQLGILVTMENPRNSCFWSTSFLIALWRQYELFCADFQVCMYGGSRDKWTRFVANYSGIEQLCVEQAYLDVRLGL